VRDLVLDRRRPHAPLRRVDHRQDALRAGAVVFMAVQINLGDETRRGLVLDWVSRGQSSA